MRLRLPVKRMPLFHTRFEYDFASRVAYVRRDVSDFTEPYTLIRAAAALRGTRLPGSGTRRKRTGEKRETYVARRVPAGTNKWASPTDPDHPRWGMRERARGRVRASLHGHG